MLESNELIKLLKETHVTDEHYLGDGLYASYDGYQIQLRAPRELSLDDSMVYLDPGVLINFFKYV